MRFRDGLVEIISEEDALTLEVQPTTEEVRESMWDCVSSKTPESDRYNMNFIKEYWDEIGPKFTAAVLDFFQSSRLPADANLTWVVLAPKFTEEKEIKDLRPISMVRMFGEAVRNGRISPLLVRKEHIELSHLQFADDTIVLCPLEEETVKNYKRILRCFELMSGLSINFDKSSLIPTNYDDRWVQHMCSVLGCKEASLQVKYLGISLGANSRLVKTWKPIIDKVEDKLNIWKAKVLNKPGKLVLIKSVLNSLPVYYLSLYKMPKAVAEKLISL
ncbi:uncharacterized protein LOC107615863 [Arachis ipaensis]|uniref:uncharacterized protein LOC107615863 n=1 Tax=Arachis ipaensis TaxID=130454 RepID=UPI0007AF544A|nr:uncharacterized protein LOC107615863 [Arachis ipaensis]